MGVRVREWPLDWSNNIRGFNGSAGLNGAPLTDPATSDSKREAVGSRSIRLVVHTASDFTGIRPAARACTALNTAVPGFVKVFHL